MPSAAGVSHHIHKVSYQASRDPSAPGFGALGWGSEASMYFPPQIVDTAPTCIIRHGGAGPLQDGACLREGWSRPVVCA